MRDTVLPLLEEQGVFGVIELLAAEADPLAATRVFGEVVGELYWKQKDLHRTVVLAQAGIQFGLTAAVIANDQDAERAGEIRGVVKGLAYNLAAFVWPGWDEPGIEISAADLAFGREAARLNLRLAHELNKPDLPVSRAYWLVGAHCLSAGEFQEALDQFTTSETYAQKAGASGEILLGKGYRFLAQRLLAPQEAGADASLEQICAQLSETPEGAELAAQLRTSWRVFVQPQVD
jgi:hypothetical protein